MHESDIVIRGAREHNLRDVNLRLPKNQLIVMTGVSGSGKSSLAFDTLYAEGQRRYVESLSSYARQFLGQMPKPEVDSITGLAPSISIQQKTSGRNPRSTVGTITEIYDYLRVLYARVGTGYCPKCDRPITAQTRDQILDTLLQLPEKTRFLVLAPVVQRQKGEYRDLFDELLKQGYLRARVDGRVVSLNENLKLDRQMRHSIEVVVDRLEAGAAGRTRLAEAVESALRLGNGSLIISVAGVPPVGGRESDVDKPRKNKRDAQPPTGGTPTGTPNDEDGATNDRLFSSRYACTHCGVSYEPPSPQLFSFNSPQGMCAECNGLALRHDFDLNLLIPDDSLSLMKGAVTLLGRFRDLGRWRRHIFEGVATLIEREHGMDEGTIISTPWRDLPAAVRELMLYGTGDRNITYSWRYRGGIWKHGGTYSGIVPELLDSYRKARNPMRRRQLEKYMRVTKCSTCHGSRLNPQARSVRIASQSLIDDVRQSTKKSFGTRNGRKGADDLRAGWKTCPTSLSLPEVCALTVSEAARFFEQLALDATGRLIAEEILKEIRGRLGFLLRCGLDYLTLDRGAPTLSGGESQRIRLAGQIGCGLVGVVYILDEPSIGLHPRDNDKLLGSLLALRDQGNTVIVVEHDEDTIRAADHVVDFGPGPGVRGGEVVAEGTLAEICGQPRSLTAKYLTGTARIEVPPQRRPVDKKQLVVHGAQHHNLRNITVSFPLESFVCVTGVSGSGKSSLVTDILWEALHRDLNEGTGNPGAFQRITGLEHLDKAIDIDQSPIGRTPRSNPATYVKLFDLIRDLYTQLPESKVRGHKPGRFSFNVSGGRCEACEGNGSTRLEMDFLADIWVTCPVCNGHRFNHETLDVRFKGANIADVLEMDVQQALVHFENVAPIASLLRTLHDVGLDYLKLGQPSPTLSGGEAQRIKLARELGKRSTGRTIYLLDEPTTGLHFADVQKLLEVLHGLVDRGNTVLVVEHNLDVVKTADWVIDLGPEGGSGGGEIVATGTPEQIAACKASHTGRALARVLAAAPGSPVDRIATLDVGRVKKGKTNARSAVKAPRIEAVARTTLADPTATNRPIVVKGASQHNLQGVDIEVPRHAMSVFCGPSGSGKSSLAMDTLYAEGQRRYVESLSAYARQFLGQMPKPRVEHISGLSPAIAIEQKTVGNTPRSTVGTTTELYDYLRILFARLGRAHCPTCGIPVETQTTDEVIERILKKPVGSKLLLLAPLVVEVGGSYDRLWERLKGQGFRRVRVNGETYTVDAVPEMDRRRKHDVAVVADRVTIGRETRKRIAESVASALDMGQGWLHVVEVDDGRPESEWPLERFSLHRTCQSCLRSFEDLSPNHFSFNSSLGWCPACEGLGTQQGTNLTALIADPRRTLAEGAVAAWPDIKKNELFGRMLGAMSRQLQIPLDVSFERLEPRHQRMILFGAGDRWITLDENKPVARRVDKTVADAASIGAGVKFQYKGLYPAVEEAARVSFSHRLQLEHLSGEVACSVCHGSRLRDDAAAVQFGGKTLQEICELPLNQCLDFFRGMKLAGSEKKIAGELLREVTGRLSFLVDVGLHYLTLCRTMPTLSGGESQRIRLAGQVGRALTGVLYVLDEPTIGLHPRDNGRLLGALRRLRDLGNTVILVEHDREVLESADRLFDFGPGAGRFGGTIVGQGAPGALKRSPNSLTGKFLSGKEQIAIPAKRRIAAESQPPGGGWLEIRGARLHNLRNVDLKIPLGTLCCVTGVSGSGKSSLIEETLSRAVAKHLHNARETPGPYDKILGLDLINKVIIVDQQPLGSTPASNPATYTGVFDHIREVFTRLPEAKIRGYRPGRFSFNRAGGRCEACEGNGQKCIEMHFLPDVWVECDACRGKRFNAETLAVRYKGQSIADVLEMSIGQALELFQNIPNIRGVLATLCAVGLDYLTLGQSAATLSGGEAQRVKLAAELARPQTGRTLYILDEPTTGLHFDDIRKLLKVLHSLVELGNTVVVIEHNLDVIKTADWIVDLGPEAGIDGGWIVATGTPETVVQHALECSLQAAVSKRTQPEGCTPTMRSHTGELLAPLLEKGRRDDVEIFDARAAAKKQSGDLDLRKLGAEARMPWQVDGRRWHTAERVGHNGRACRWEGTALAFVIDVLESETGFAPVNWNDRSVVELTGAGAPSTWFLHALTGDEWLLTLRFRVGRNTFADEQLARQLALKPLDDLDELPVYGRGDRVRVKNLKGPWQEVTVTVHWLREIDTPEFRAFLKRAASSYLQRTQATPLNVDDLTPWKVLGKKWHLSRKGFPSGKRVQWEPDVLERLADQLEGALPRARIDWTGKQVVHVYRDGSEEPWATIQTKRRSGVDVSLFGPAGRFALGKIANLGSEREIVSAAGKPDQIKIRIDSSTQLSDPAFARFIQEHAQHK
jgi:excinuclease ABC subunit A